MERNDRYARGFYGNAIEPVDMGKLEGSGSSGRIDPEILASEGSSVLKMKCMSLNYSGRETLGVSTQVLSWSNMAQSERKELIQRLRMELEQTRILQKKVEMHGKNGTTVSSSSGIISCSKNQNGLQVDNRQKTSNLISGQGKRVNPPDHGKGQGLNRDPSGRFESTTQDLVPITASAILMKQCETLLKRMMSHQYAWVFNTPVDVVKLNIPDYFTVIKHPMDLGTVKMKLASGGYSSPLEFLADVRLTFTNAMTYNPSGTDVHLMADTLSKYFEVRWKAIGKKLPKTNALPVPVKSGSLKDSKPMISSKKRKTTSVPPEVLQMPVKCAMSDEEKNKLGSQLESLLGEIPIHVIDFLRSHSSNGRDCVEDEIEIDIDGLSDDTLWELRKLIDEYLEEKEKNEAITEPCEIELLNESGLSNSSMQPGKGSDPVDDDIDIGGNDPPVSSYPPETKQDTAARHDKYSGPRSSRDSRSSSASESDDGKSSSLVKATEGRASTFDSEALEKKFLDEPLERYQSVSGLDQVDQTPSHKPSSVELDCLQGDSTPRETQVSPGKLYRAAVLKNRFADTILRAREKTMSQGEKGDPEKLRREREELEHEHRKEKARLQAEAKAAEDARRRAEAEAAAEIRQKRELEREAARQALLQMEKTVEINENSRFLEDLEMLTTATVDQLPSSVDELSPEQSQDCLGSFKFRGSNPLEQLGLFMKMDEDDEEGEPPIPDSLNDVEEGEID